MRVPLRIVGILVAGWLAAGSLSVGAETPTGIHRADGTAISRIVLGAAAGSPTPLLVEPPFQAVPSLEIGTLDGPPVRLGDQRGRVVLLDFWASWCPPCLQELPELERLWRSERERGLVAVAINGEEPDPVARETAQRLGLSMPIGRYDEAIDAAFRVRKMPTVVLVDRQGRIRARWDGWRDGLEKTIAATARKLLGDDPEGRPIPVADVVAGAGVLEVAWMHRLGAAVSGIAAMPPGDAARRVAVAAGGSLTFLGAGGEKGTSLMLPPGSGAPRLAPGGGTLLVGWRPASQDLTTIDVAREAVLQWRAPAPVADLAVEPRPEGGARVLLATEGGLVAVGVDGSSATTLGPERPVRSVVVADGARAALSDGAVLRLDVEGRVASETRAERDGTRLVAVGGDEIALAPVAVLDRAIGTFLPEGRAGLALTTEDGRVVVLDVASGAVAWQASWAGARAIAAADLDGDGRDELLVGAGPTLYALRAVTPPAS